MGTESYVVFSNKGGTGKTTLAFQLAAEYALQHEDYQVVVIDLCPQANVSQTLLSKTQKYPLRSQPGQFYVSKASKPFLKEVDSGKVYENTVCGYLMAILDEKDSQIGTLDCQRFLIKVHRYNREIPENVFLLCGDRYLDVLSKRLEQERQLSPTRHDNPWKRVTLFIKDFIDSVSEDPDWHSSCFVIDTSSNFSIYTEMAISAAKNLIVPFTADDFSLSSIESMLYMVYGYESDKDILKDERLQSFKKSQYFWLAKKNRIECSQLLFFVFNRVTFYESKPANAFDAIRDRLIYILKQVLKYDSRRSRKIFRFSPDFWDDKNIWKTLQKRYIVDVHDFHTTGIVSLHSGCPMSEVENGYHRVYRRTCQVNMSRVLKYNDDINKILQKMS